MRKTFYIFILLCTFHFTNSQVAEKVYFSRGHQYSTVYSYFISEIVISSDSTFTSYSYKVSNKKGWKNYKNYVPDKSEGKISKNGKFYLFTEFINGNDTDFIDYVKIKNRKLIFFLKDENETFEKVYTMKRKS